MVRLARSKRLFGGGCTDDSSEDLGIVIKVVLCNTALDFNEEDCYATCDGIIMSNITRSSGIALTKGL